MDTNKHELVISATSTEEVCHRVAEASAAGRKVASVDLRRMDAVLEHKAEDMTATVQAGKTLEAFQHELRKCGQWLPIDPPAAATLTIAELLNKNASGPRRYGYGTIRDHLIGLKVVLADGRVITSGGKVVKNVAGYDLAKLFIGGGGSLGIIVEATFKLRPVAEAERFVQRSFDTVEGSEKIIETIAASELSPVVFDAYRSARDQQIRIVLGFAGSVDEVEWQTCKAAQLGLTESGSLDYENDFWSKEGVVEQLSVAPSRLSESLRQVNGPFVVRVGNGIVYFRGAVERKRIDPTVVTLMRRLKTEFDPKQILTALPW